MIAHIVLKDLRRLWPFVAGLAALHLALALLRVKLGLFPDDHGALQQLAQYMDLLAGLLVFFTAVLAVQLDPLPGDRQDWLVRPVRRRDLLAAKLAFMVAAVLAPLFIAGLLEGLLSGFGLGRALAASASWTLYEFVNPMLPALAVAAVSRSIGQSLGITLAVVVGAIVLIGGSLWAYGAATGARFSNVNTLGSWLAVHVLLVVGVITILRLQYFRRATARSRVILGVFVVLLTACQLLLPYRAAMAAQGWLMGGPDIEIAFVPQARKPVTDLAAPPHADPSVRFALPVEITGLPPGLVLLGDRIEATITAPDGATMNWQNGDTRVAAGAPFQQVVSVPLAFARAHAGQKVRVEIEYLLNVMRPGSVHRIAAKGGDVWLAEGAHCASRVKADGTGVSLGCLQPGNLRARLSAELLDGSAGRPGAWRVRHFPSDAPYSNASGMIVPFDMELPLRDPDAALPEVEVRMAQPLTHILRRVVIDGLRLQDWAAGATAQ